MSGSSRYDGPNDSNLKPRYLRAETADAQFREVHNVLEKITCKVDDIVERVAVIETIQQERKDAIQERLGNMKESVRERTGAWAILVAIGAALGYLLSWLKGLGTSK
jgi:chaperonin GroEL (HSP60 family)